MYFHNKIKNTTPSVPVKYLHFSVTVHYKKVSDFTGKTGLPRSSYSEYSLLKANISLERRE